VTSSNYHSPRRAEAAAATREAIVRSARELFLDRGYDAVTVTEIAKAARVAVQTVYTSTGGKADILREILAPAIHDASVEETLSAVAETDDPRAIIEFTGRGTRLAHERHWNVLSGLLYQCRAEPAAAAVLEAGNAQYLAALRTIGNRLIELNAPRVELDDADVLDLLWFHLGQGAWLTLVGERGWTFDRAQSWLTEAAQQALLRPRAKRRRA
jgi:AcrR family transcriptional regulator